MESTDLLNIGFSQTFNLLKKMQLFTKCNKMRYAYNLLQLSIRNIIKDLTQIAYKQGRS